jgi:D-glycero-D-manno-heptose 1,7-bisphosphate phosphatase
MYNKSFHLRKSTFNLGTHIRTQLQGIIIGFLFGRELLVIQVLSESRADFQCCEKLIWSILQHVAMIELLDCAKSAVCSIRDVEVCMKEIQRIVFLDRDGVLNRAFPEDGTTRPPRSIDELELMPEVPEAMGRLRAAGFALVVITNQPDVARGRLSRTVVEAINQKLSRQLPLLDAFTCYHDASDGCECRKPKAGLLFAAARKWSLDLERGFMIGDRWSDVVAAQSAGCRGVLIDTPFSQADRCSPDYRTKEIAEAVDWILATAGKLSA